MFLCIFALVPLTFHQPCTLLDSSVFLLDEKPLLQVGIDDISPWLLTDNSRSLDAFFRRRHDDNIPPCFGFGNVRVGVRILELEP
mmetsp:Transcript_2114/g.3034  ORF Transcript_2114/g.3034 Transcript_2114/m.3034 type:complete len:85 (+) Transcript_2114:89-343(+)